MKMKMTLSIAKESGEKYEHIIETDITSGEFVAPGWPGWASAEMREFLASAEHHLTPVAADECHAPDGGSVPGKPDNSTDGASR